jgi:hypothetical protein
VLIGVLAPACGGTDDGGGGEDASADGATVDSGGKSDGAVTPGKDAGSVDAAKDAKAECTKNQDCDSGICNIAKGVCNAASCADGAKNATETDTDCGGSCKACDTGKKCLVAADCTSSVCKDVGMGLQCQAPTNTDGVQNGVETGIDCGGMANPLCADGLGCKVRGDCVSDVCVGGKCVTPVCNDGAKNGSETDVDCGGAGCPRCADTQACKVADDCTSGVCKDVGMGLQCQAPSPTDGIKNGTESDVDCGGAGNPTCVAGLACLLDTDCTSQGCDYTNHCAIARSCKAHYGGDTCGFGGDGSLGPAAWESCCATAPVVPTTGATKGKTVNLSKYPVTSGRMRVFMESIGYDVRTFVQQARAAGTMPKLPADAAHYVLEPAWDMYLPTSFSGNQNADEISDCNQGGTCTQVNGECPATTTCIAGQEQAGLYTSVRNHLGGNIFKNNSQTATGCYVGSPGTHSFRFPDDKQDGAPPDQDQATYDTKSQNCVDYLVGQAFCVWDGGRLELLEEWQAGWGPGALPWSAVSALVPAEPADRIDDMTNKPLAGGDKTYWGCRFPWTTDGNQAGDACGLHWDVSKSIEYADYKYSYEYPKQGSNGNPNDYIVFLTAPGRTRGRGPNGHSDIVGTGFELTSNVTYNASVFSATHRWTGNGSWEVHGYGRGGGGTTELLNKYGKLGMRCAY